MKVFILISTDGDEIFCNVFSTKLKAIAEWEKWTGIDTGEFDDFDGAQSFHFDMASEPDEVVRFVEREIM